MSRIIKRNVGGSMTVFDIMFCEYTDFRNGPQVEATVRLVNGINACSGRVEVLYNGTWGTVCDYGWDLREAAVVCYEAGCGAGIAAYTAAHFGQGSGQIWRNNVDCLGTESSLMNCKWLKQSCTHQNDAGVTCQAGPSVRLVNGFNPCSGRVEVLHNGTWGTVCDNGWDLLDAAVVCKEVGCGDAIEAKIGAYFEQGSGQIWMDAAQCTGSEALLESCASTKWGIQSCDHSKDAGVVCTLPVRLVNGDNSCSGRVEVLHNGIWGTVCDDYWDIIDGGILCRELGCGNAIVEKTDAFFGEGLGPILMDNVNCIVSDSKLTKCQTNGWGISNCEHYEDAGVICQPLVRLVNGPFNGRVEVYHDGDWGTVCDDGWDLADASAVCRELGFWNATAIKTSSFFGQGSGPVWVSNAQCTGDEASLKSCPSMVWQSQNCSHDRDVGIVCRGRSKTIHGCSVESIMYKVIICGLYIVNHCSSLSFNGDLAAQLIGGECFGRVEVFHHGSGEECAQITGTPQMPRWCAKSWDVQPMVKQRNGPISDRVWDPYGYKTLHVRGQNHP
nr:deleted in malignant brain tumors 1 protein-like [Misgurnus anguillicaudatus]